MINIEGIDSVGKMTQTRLLHSWFEEQGLDSAALEFPDYTTIIGQQIKSFLAGEVDYPAEVRHILFAANRWEKANLIRTQLRSHDVLLVNRYTESNLAYGVANGLSLDWLRNLEYGLPKPKIVIVLDAPPSSVRVRRLEKEDTYEKNRVLQEKVRTVYKKLARKYGWLIVDGIGTIDQVHSSLVSTIVSVLKPRNRI